MRTGEPIDDDAREWANEIAELALGRAIFMDTHGLPPKLQVGDTATVIYNTIRNKKQGMGRRSLMFVPELAARFTTLQESKIEDVLRRLQEDGHIAPVHFRSQEGKTFIGYRATNAEKIPQPLIDAVMAAIRKAGQAGASWGDIAKEFSGEDFEPALDRLVSSGRVTQHLTGSDTTNYLFIAAVQIRSE